MPEEERLIRGLHPMIAQRLDLWRLENFDITRLPAVEDVYLFRCVARENSADERLVALAEVRDLTPLRDAASRVMAFPAVERVLTGCLNGIRDVQAQRLPNRRLDANRVFLYAWPPIEVRLDELTNVARAMVPLTVGAGLEEVMILGRLQEQPHAAAREVALGFSYQPGVGVGLAVTEPPTEPLLPLDEYTQKVRRARARGTVYPYELLPLLTGGTAPSPSTTSTRAADSSRSTGPPASAATARELWSGWCASPPTATPRAWSASTGSWR